MVPPSRIIQVTALRLFDPLLKNGNKPWHEASAKQRKESQGEA